MLFRSPRAVSVFLQRVGRSGHSIGKTPRGRLFPLSRDDLVECVALFRAIHAGMLDEIRIPRAPLDVLAQQIVAVRYEIGPSAPVSPGDEVCAAVPGHRVMKEGPDRLCGCLRVGAFGSNLVDATEYKVEPVAQRERGSGRRQVEARDQSRTAPGRYRVEDRVERDERIVGEVHLGHQSGAERFAEIRERTGLPVLAVVSVAEADDLRVRLRELRAANPG